MRRAATIVVLLAAGCQSAEDGGGLDLERMVRQPRADAYEESSVFPDRKVMQEPPEGTVVHDPDRPPAPVRTGFGEDGWLQRIPVTLDRAVLERGRRRFGVYCAPCHGHDGNGSTPVAAAMTLQPPPSLHAPRVREHPPGMLYAVVRRGYGLMPGYEAQLSVEERWAVVAYVQALQLAAAVPLDSLPAGIRSEAVEALGGAR